MKLLLDTCTLLWFLTNDRKLSLRARTGIEDLKNERRLSPASLMEIALKVRIQKLHLPAPFAVMFPSLLNINHVELLAIEAHHIEPLTSLPLHHKDPFDRLIAATALSEGLTLISADSAFDAYGVTRIW